MSAVIEPVASLDPLARREFLQDLMESVAEQEVSVVLSSHLIGDLERVCDYVIVLVDSRVRVAGSVDELLAAHHLVSGPRRDPASLPGGLEVISASHTDVQTTLLVRTSGPVLDPARLAVSAGTIQLAREVGARSVADWLGRSGRSRDGPSRNVPVEMMFVAITYGK